MKILRTFFNSCRHLPEWIWVVIAYAISHLFSLTLLPVFADEAIYIRWAQLIQDDAARYAFFSMADGKPPLFMWILTGVLHLGTDPLFIGRLLSAAIGLVTVFVLRALVIEFSKDPVARLVTTYAGIVLPFWFFYHRMVLMDGLLTLLLALTFFFALQLAKKPTVRSFMFMAVSFGLAMMTKTPALFAIPIIAITPVYVWLEQRKRKSISLFRTILMVGAAGVVGMLFFLSLRVSPLFGALFSRSGDFTFTTHDLISGEWKYVFLESFPHNIIWLAAYLTPELFVLSFMGLCFKRTRASVSFFLLCAFLFFSPLTLIGRVLWPRYFLPVSIFMTLALGISSAELIKHKVSKVLCYVLLFTMSIRCAYFIGISLRNVAQIPFVIEDKKQYLTEWSAGYGNIQVRNFIVQQQSKLPQDGSRKIIVLTEGSFGTLPDGLLMYFHTGNAKNLEIHGIGVSIPRIPQEYIELSKSNDVYYMVNSHRFGIIDQSILSKVFEVKRPEGINLLFFKVQAK